MQKINPCLWFTNNAKEAAEFYTSLFKNSKIGNITHYGESAAKASGQKIGSILTIDFELDGLSITGLNGGEYFKNTPALSFVVGCENEQEVQDLWQKLSNGGEVRMGLDAYPWASKYGWTTDKYGVEWQLTISPVKQKITPAFLFVQDLVGKGEEAINFYMSLFKNSKIESLVRDETNKSIMHCLFTLAGQYFVLMEGQGPHNFTFSPAFSFEINCDNQEEVDTYWDKLTQGGVEEQCGWLRDKYGVSWQVVPTALKKMLENSDSPQAERAMEAMINMIKLDIKTIEQAYNLA